MISVKDFGAAGTGERLDTAAVNAAVVAAHGQGGGTVVLPAGRYLCFSIRLLSGVNLHLEDGAELIAADPGRHDGQYDAAEDNAFDLYQDFGHSHWRNSLIWAEAAEAIGITGHGLINGIGLTREGPGSRWRKQDGEFPLSMRGLSATAMASLCPDVAAMQGQGNKAIGLKDCRRVAIRDVAILNGGHFAILATGVEDLAIDSLTIDTNRDGIDIDACRRVSILDCRVNTPNDDAIVLKASFALGRVAACEDIEISRCWVGGFDLGTMYDGTFARTQSLAPDQDHVTGRIKIGTESNGDFRHIRIRDCTFRRSRGLALETVDGGVIEDVVVERLSMEEITTAPLFFRVGARLRGPEGRSVGGIRDAVVRDVTATGIRPDYAALLVGLPDGVIKDVSLENLCLTFDGGLASADVPDFPGDLPTAYPEPSMFGVTPAWGLWTRHVVGLALRGLQLATTRPDDRPMTCFEQTRLADA